MAMWKIGPVVDLQDVGPAIEYPSFLQPPVLVTDLIDSWNVVMSGDRGMKGRGVQDDGGGHTRGLLPVLLPQLLGHLDEHSLRWRFFRRWKAMSETASCNLASPAANACSERAMFSHRLARSSSLPSSHPLAGQRTVDPSAGLERIAYRYFVTSMAFCRFRWATLVRVTGIRSAHGLFHQMPARIESYAQPRLGLPFDGPGRVYLGLDDQRLSTGVFDQDVRTQARTSPNRAGLLSAHRPLGMPSIKRLRKELVQLWLPQFAMYRWFAWLHPLDAGPLFVEYARGLKC